MSGTESESDSDSGSATSSASAGTAETPDDASCSDSGGSARRSRWAWVAVAVVLDLSMVGFIFGVSAGRLDWGALPPELATAFLAAVAASNAKALGKSPSALFRRKR